MWDRSVRAPGLRRHPRERARRYTPQIVCARPMIRRPGVDPLRPSERPVPVRTADEAPGAYGQDGERPEDVEKHAVLSGEREALPCPEAEVEHGRGDEQLEVPGHLGRLADRSPTCRARPVAVHRRRRPELRALLAPRHQATPPLGAPSSEEIAVEFRQLFPRDAASRGPAAASRLATGWSSSSDTTALASRRRSRSMPVPWPMSSSRYTSSSV